MTRDEWHEITEALRKAILFTLLGIAGFVLTCICFYRHSSATLGVVSLCVVCMFFSYLAWFEFGELRGKKVRE